MGSHQKEQCILADNISQLPQSIHSLTFLGASWLSSFGGIPLFQVVSQAWGYRVESSISQTPLVLEPYCISVSSPLRTEVWGCWVGSLRFPHLLQDKYCPCANVCKECIWNPGDCHLEGSERESRAWRGDGSSHSCSLGTVCTWPISDL